MNHVLLDTNIILDSLLERQPFADDAEAIWQLCEDMKIVGYVSALTLANVLLYCPKTTRA